MKRETDGERQKRLGEKRKTETITEGEDYETEQQNMRKREEKKATESVNSRRKRRRKRSDK